MNEPRSIFVLDLCLWDAALMGSVPGASLISERDDDCDECVYNDGREWAKRAGSGRPPPRRWRGLQERP